MRSAVQPRFNHALNNTSKSTSRNPAQMWRTQGFILACSIASIIGCGPSGPVMTPVRGTVEYGGDTLTNGKITFSPKDPKEGRVAESDIAEDGTFSLSTYKNGDGAIVGTYKVSIVSTKEGTEVLEKDKGTGIGGKTAIPLIYSDPNTSGLTETVERGNADITIVLQGKL